MNRIDKAIQEAYAAVEAHQGCDADGVPIGPKQFCLQHGTFFVECGTMEHDAGLDMVGEPGNDHGAHETFAEDDMERERRLR